MINTALFTPRNFIVIGIIALISHVVAKPIYAMVDAKKDAE